jgi:hypothetical protein
LSRELTCQIIHTLTSGKAPAMGADWWVDDAIVDSTAADCQRIGLKAGELRAEATRIMATVTRTPENIERVRDLMHRAQALDEQITAWMHSVPDTWKFRTLCWQLHNLAVPGGSDYFKAEVFPGRVDMYSDFWVAGVWNQDDTHVHRRALRRVGVLAQGLPDDARVRDRGKGVPRDNLRYPGIDSLSFGVAHQEEGSVQGPRIGRVRVRGGICHEGACWLLLDLAAGVCVNAGLYDGCPYVSLLQ